MIGQHEGAADRIANHLHAAGRHLTARRTAGNPLDDSVNEAPEPARYDDGEDDEEDEP
jgi:hypothetical protein